MNLPIDIFEILLYNIYIDEKSNRNAVFLRHMKGPDKMNEAERDEIITLTDEDGNETEFVIVDGVELEGKQYLALVESSHIDDEECEFIILRLDEGETEDESILATIEDEDEFNAVLAALEEKLEDDYDFEDEE